MPGEGIYATSRCRAHAARCCAHRRVRVTIPQFSVPAFPVPPFPVGLALSRRSPPRSSARCCFLFLVAPIAQLVATGGVEGGAKLGDRRRAATRARCSRPPPRPPRRCSASSAGRRSPTSSSGGASAAGPSLRRCSTCRSSFRIRSPASRCCSSSGATARGRAALVRWAAHRRLARGHRLRDAVRLGAARTSAARVRRSRAWIRRYEAVARTLGDPRWRVFRRVTLPLSGRGLVAAAVVMWARAVSEFGAIVILTYNPKIASVLSYDRFTSFGLREALPVAAVLAVLALLPLTALRALRYERRRGSTSPARAGRRVIEARGLSARVGSFVLARRHVHGPARGVRRRHRAGRIREDDAARDDRRHHAAVGRVACARRSAGLRAAARSARAGARLPARLSVSAPLGRGEHRLRCRGRRRGARGRHAHRRVAAAGAGGGFAVGWRATARGARARAGATAVDPAAGRAVQRARPAPSRDARDASCARSTASGESRCCRSHTTSPRPACSATSRFCSTAAECFRAGSPRTCSESRRRPTSPSSLARRTCSRVRDA